MPTRKIIVPKLLLVKTLFHTYSHHHTFLLPYQRVFLCWKSSFSLFKYIFVAKQSKFPRFKIYILAHIVPLS